MLPKQAKKNYLCSQIEKRKTMKHTNPQVEQMTSFIVMDVLERANELQKQGIDIIHLEVGEPDFDGPKLFKLCFFVLSSRNFPRLTKPITITDTSK